jgi:hypothetical protein
MHTMKRTHKTTKLKANQPTNVYTIKDKHGNKVISTHHGTFATVRLKLNEENFHREIGTVLFDKREFHVRRQRTKHLLIKANAYGFNHYILDNAQMFDYVMLEDEHERWRIPRQTILEEGNFLHFKNNGGFELQIFMSLAQLEPFKVT